MAGLHSTKKVHHISSTPLPPCRFSNIQPLAVPSVSTAQLPVTPQSFETAYSMSLPSRCASTEIPGVLDNVNRCLKLGGTAHLMLVDPMPRSGTMGQLLRKWLERNLLVNLEKQSRCLSPSTVFPRWLGEAGLRGPGSTLTTIKFYATPQSAHEKDVDPDPSIQQTRSDRQTEAKIRSLAGRSFWQEVWGTYVTADKWWWEDDACVEECLQLGTFWEYRVIEGVKDREVKT